MFVAFMWSCVKCCKTFVKSVCEICPRCKVLQSVVAMQSIVKKLCTIVSSVVQLFVCRCVVEVCRVAYGVVTRCRVNAFVL